MNTGTRILKNKKVTFDGGVSFSILANSDGPHAERVVFLAP